MSYVYRIDYYDDDCVNYVDYVLGDDMYTALSKWRTKIANEHLGLEEPQSIARLNEAEIIP